MVVYSMNLIEFTNSVQQPSKITEKQTVGLETILEEFPYFQAAHYLLLNGLKNQNSFKYNNYLKKTAAYTTDRSVLFDNISTSNYSTNQNKKLKNIKVNNLEIVDSPIKKEIKTNYELDQPGNLPLKKPFQFDTSETFSFNEWLQIGSIKPIQRDGNIKKNIKSFVKEIKNPVQVSISNFDLIEKFLASKPKLEPAGLDNNDNIAIESIRENESLMTETLAHVYLEQKKYQKAITAFTVLSLKYPEKSSFFANQIKAIEKLQEK